MSQKKEICHKKSVNCTDKNVYDKNSQWKQPGS